MQLSYNCFSCSDSRNCKQTEQLWVQPCWPHRAQIPAATSKGCRHWGTEHKAPVYLSSYQYLCLKGKTFLTSDLADEKPIVLGTSFSFGYLQGSLSKFKDYVSHSFKTVLQHNLKAAIVHGLTTTKINSKNIKHKVLHIYGGVTC